MGRAVLQSCLPWLVLLLASCLAACFLLRVNRSQIRLGRLLELHRDQVGNVQSLSFVLTLPFFVMVMLLIVQVSQLMIGTIVVHYAAFAAARSAAVWIPAALPLPEGANCISSYYPDPAAPNEHPSGFDRESSDDGFTEGGTTYVIATGSPKYNQIAAAAVLACTPICPSRDLGIGLPAQAGAGAGVLKAAYAAMVPGSTANPRIGPRLENKLAYALQNTKVEMRFYHKNSEPPLVTYHLEDDIAEFRDNEVGWQDPITVTVKHDLALLPGAGRLLSYFVPGTAGSDRVASQIGRNSKVYVYPLAASATVDIEGEKSVIPYAYQTR